MMYSEVIKDFVYRTKCNLEEIESLKENGHNVFEATQLINSMLGLLVFPQQKYIDEIPKIPIYELEKNGWPIPKVIGNFEQVEDLNQLIRYLRNAIAHFNIEFIGDGKHEIAILRIWNNRRGKKIWQVNLSLEDLRNVTIKFIELIESDKMNT